MTIKYLWAGTEYTSMAEVNTAANAKKTELETAPTNIVFVKRLSGSAEEGWVVPQENLTDAELLSVTEADTNFYSVTSITDGDTSIALTATTMLAEVDRLLRKYGTWMELNTVRIIEERDCEVDMSNYINVEA